MSMQYRQQPRQQAPPLADSHSDVNVWQLADALRGVQRILHQLADGGVQALAGLHRHRHRQARHLGGAAVAAAASTLARRLGPLAPRASQQPQRHWLTLSNPAMVRFSAKNSAGLFCCSTSALPALGAMVQGRQAPPPRRQAAAAAAGSPRAHCPARRWPRRVFSLRTRPLLQALITISFVRLPQTAASAVSQTALPLAGRPMQAE